MELVTFQSIDALKDLIKKGYLECDTTKINIEKAGPTYEWVIENMNKHLKNPYNVKYPLWCWVKCYNSICPPKHKGTPVNGFDVKITFNKNEEDVFITDFRRYSFLLNNIYIPKNLQEKAKFDQKLQKYNITKEELKAYVRKDKYSTHRLDKEYLEICQEIKNTFDLCITKDSDILQGCIWRLELTDIKKIEFLNDKNYCYGSLNYIRSNGQRINWQQDFYQKLR